MIGHYFPIFSVLGFEPLFLFVLFFIFKLFAYYLFIILKLFPFLRVFNFFIDFFLSSLDCVALGCR